MKFRKRICPEDIKIGKSYYVDYYYRPNIGNRGTSYKGKVKVLNVSYPKDCPSLNGEDKNYCWYLCHKLPSSRESWRNEINIRDSAFLYEV